MVIIEPNLTPVRDDMTIVEPNLTLFTDDNEIVELNLTPSFPRVTALPRIDYFVGQVQVFT